MTEISSHTSSLDPFFHPRGIALIGASRDQGKLSYGVLSNLLDSKTGYPGPVYPVNPKAADILGRRCYPDISVVPDPVDLAILVIPANLVPGAVEDCGKRGIKAAVIISGGFREVGPEGAAREQQIVEIAHRYDVRLMGPNGIGVIDTHTPLNTTFIRGMPARGDIAFLSQSGALCGGVIDWIIGRGIGFSRLLSVGNEADVNETDALLSLAADDHTRVITLYLEDVKDGPGFMAALRKTTATKPVLVLKTGRTANGQAATASHTGALAGVHAAFRAACRQNGAIEVESIETMFNGALALAYQPLPKGKRIAIVTNAGGPAALAADVMEPNGLTLAQTSPETQIALRKILLPDAQTAGPVDMLGGASTQEYEKTLELVMSDGSNDGVLAILVPQALNNPEAVVRSLAKVSHAQHHQKPLLVCLMGEASVHDAFQLAHQERLPAYIFPEAAIQAFGMLYRQSQWIASLSHTPDQSDTVNLTQALALLESARSSGRTALDAAECQAIVETAGIPVPTSLVATTQDEAAEYARQVGFPVVLKLVSPDILHKTDIGGVILSVQNETAANEGYHIILERAHAAHPHAHILGVQVQKMIAGGQEVILGVKRDPTFGPLLMFGLGGIYVETLADVSFRIAPLTYRDAEEMIDEVRSSKLLAGVRGAPPADREALIDVMLKLSRLAAQCTDIIEMDINPLIVLPTGGGVIAADVRIILQAY